MLTRLSCLMLTLALLWLAPWAARAQSLESALAPGRLIQGHAKWDDDCKACHVRFDRSAQDRLCADCHKDVGADLRARTGFHGRIKPDACRSCHTEHKGRDASIARFDTRTFDHKLSDYQLRGNHASTDCAKCHLPGRKYREAASDCNACHRKDDTHKGSLGPKCGDCHTEQNWKEAKFDHEKTRFALTGKHADAGCADCHRNKADYKDTPRSCIGCHRKDDDGAKGHKGLYGERCDSCHNAKAWKPSTFRHDVDTRYPLRGRHAGVKCADCHSGHLYKVKLQQECVSCHKKDDKHQGTLGEKCESCHTERDWKEKARFDHDRTEFPLLGKHAELRCDACHKSTMFKEAPKTCIGCHKADDKHAGTLGAQCGSCHNERDWKTTGRSGGGRFDHDRTQFRLRNAHAAPKVECRACHADLKSFRKTPTDCDSCHRKDDRHAGQLGRDCASCHDDRSWRVASFNHSRTRFALLGRHAAVLCKDCHATPRYQDAPRACIGCHDKDDRHKRAFGEACDSCHNPRAWPLWAFEHNQRSSYKLDGAHRQVPCEACHTRPAPKGKAFAPVGSTCIACHRKDDVHDGSFGTTCEQCHGTTAWKTLIQRGLRTGAVSPAPVPQRALLAAVFGESSHITQGRP